MGGARVARLRGPLFIPCVSDHYSRFSQTPFVASQPCSGILSFPTLGLLGRVCGTKLGEMVCMICILWWGGAGVSGTLLLAKDTDPITIDMPLLASFLSPALAFLPFWESRGSE